MHSVNNCVDNGRLLEVKSTIKLWHICMGKIFCKTNVKVSLPEGESLHLRVIESAQIEIEITD